MWVRLEEGTETVDLSGGILRTSSRISLKICAVTTSLQNAIRVLQKYRSCRFRIVIVYLTEIDKWLEVRYGDDSRHRALESRDLMPALPSTEPRPLHHHGS